jgi:hypothetical protein
MKLDCIWLKERLLFMAVFHMILVVGNGVESTFHVGAIFLLSFLHMIPAHCKSEKKKKKKKKKKKIDKTTILFFF